MDIFYVYLLENLKLVHENKAIINFRARGQATFQLLHIFGRSKSLVDRNTSYMNVTFFTYNVFIFVLYDAKLSHTILTRFWHLNFFKKKAT